MRILVGCLGPTPGVRAIRNGLSRMRGPGYVGLQFALGWFHCFISFHRSRHGKETVEYGCDPSLGPHV